MREETLSVYSRTLNESTKCDGKFSKDFPTCIKIAENAQPTITTQRDLRENPKGKNYRRGDYTLIRKNYKQRSVAL